MSRIAVKLRYGLLLLSLLLGACASPVPQHIRQAPADDPSLAAVHDNAADYLGRQVRWGGVIIGTANREDTTRLTVLGRPLRGSGQPRYTDDSGGRFIAIVPAFLEPKVYAPDRRITVAGTLLRTEAGKVGDFAYTYPVVQADTWYLWPVNTERRCDSRNSGWCDTWGCRPRCYDRWYPYGYWR